MGSAAAVRAPAGRSAPARPRRDLAVPLAGALAVLLAAAGYALREERYLVPDRGPGYALGLFGLGCMVALLVYPLRKRWRPLHRFGRLAAFFRAHMLLGILGPLAVLFHANFRLGSRNSTVALVAMLLVAGSGFLGRFVYARIHRGLYGRRLRLQEVEREAAYGWVGLQQVVALDPALAGPFLAFERELSRPVGPLAAARRFLAVGRRARRLARAADRALLRAGVPDREASRAAVERYLRAAVDVARFTACERLFALWHAVHVPLCALLFGAAAVHVAAVHLF